MSSDNDALKTFYEKIWKTRGTRFIAAARLKHMNGLSVASVAILSVYVLLISTLAIVFQKMLSDLGQSVLNAANISLSIIILAFSLIENARNHLGNSDAMTSCAMALSKIYNKFQPRYLDKAVSSDQLLKFSEEYDGVIASCPLNHLLIDLDKFKQENRDQFGLSGCENLITRWQISAAWWLSILWLYLLAIVLPPVVLWVLFFHFGTAFIVTH